MRGSLIFAFLAELHRLDTQATAADPDGAGPLTAGYDPDFKEPILVDPDDDGLGQSTRREHPAVQVPCQVEPEVFEALAMFASGNSPSSQVKLVFHFRDLERLELVAPVSGEARVRVGDRLGALFDRSGVLVQRIRTPPGLYVTEARSIGFGLFRPRPQRNLLLVTFEPRRVAAPRLSP